MGLEVDGLGVIKRRRRKMGALCSCGWNAIRGVGGWFGEGRGDRGKR